MQKLVDIARRTLAVDQKAADAARHALDGTVRTRQGNRSDNASPRGTYRTRDDKWVALSASTPASAAALFKNLGLGHLLQDARGRLDRAGQHHAQAVQDGPARSVDRGIRAIVHAVLGHEVGEQRGGVHDREPTTRTAGRPGGAGSPRTAVRRQV